MIQIRLWVSGIQETDAMTEIDEIIDLERIKSLGVYRKIKNEGKSLSEFDLSILLYIAVIEELRWTNSLLRQLIDTVKCLNPKD